MHGDVIGFLFGMNISERMYKQDINRFVRVAVAYGLVFI
jgi:hypothetical protein